MADKLTIKQNQAVHDRGGKLLVSAAAGSGKTKVLVERLLSYITDPVDPANVDDFLIVTFTKAAASELRGKIASAISARIAEEPNNAHLHNQMRRLYLAKISTVHGFCSDILKENAYRLDIPGDFRVAEKAETDQLREEAVWSVLENAYTNAWNDGDIQSFLDGNEFSKNDTNLADILNDVFDSAASHKDPVTWLDECVRWSQVDDVLDASETIWGRYLLDDLHYHLGLHIEALEKCLQAMQNEPSLLKATAVIENELSTYRAICTYETWDETVYGLCIGYDTLRFPIKFDDKQLIESIKAVRNGAKTYVQINSARIFNVTSEQILQDLRSTVGVTKGLVKLVKEYIQTYDQLKMHHHILDFNDLEHKTLDLFWGKSRSAITNLAKEVGSRFREVMVDEYQDTNAVQDGIFRALTMEKNNCFMVGDVKQSIYQFRLADPSIFLERYNRYVPAENAAPGEGRKVVLSDNFRSSAGVISGVNDVFSLCMSQRVGGITYSGDEILREGIPHEHLGESEVELYAVDADNDAAVDEATFVAKRIKELLDGTHMIREKDSLRPIRPEDITILLRSTKTSAANYHYALNMAGISTSAENNGNILLTEEISALHALLCTISNPEQDIPLLGALTSRIFRFTTNDLALLRIERRNGSLYSAVRSSKMEKALHFTQLLMDFREKSRMCNVAELLNYILQKTHLDILYGGIDNGEKRRNNVLKFVEYAYCYCSNGHRTLDQFLTHLDMVQTINFEDTQSKATGVTIGTIHSSKGLEYPVVFLCDLSHNIRFEDNKKQVICHKELGIGFNCVDPVNRVHHPSIAKRAIIKRAEEDTLCEEMRILYVAMTRPKDRLIMTCSVKNLQKDLSNTVLKMPFASSEMICNDAICLGDWIMYTALRKLESEELFRLAGNPGMGSASDHPWKVCAVQGVSQIDESFVPIESTKDIGIDLDIIKKALSFSYPHSVSTRIPSKLTATQVKGRALDSEVTENAPQKTNANFYWRKPLCKESDTAAASYGTALHKIMEHIALSQCDTVESISREIMRIRDLGLITDAQAEAADVDGILSFFLSDIGKLAKSSQQVYREFKFSVLTKAKQYYSGATDEQILLQGIVDFAVVNEDKIYLVDFKTDYVTEETLPQVAAKYASQVVAYKRALENIFMKKVVRSQLYFFRLKKFVDIT